MSETILKKDSEWSVIDDEPCRVLEFIPTATIQNGKILAPNKKEPYAQVILECKKLPKMTKGLIFHRTDFRHLWGAFKERGVQWDEEVIILYGKEHLKGYAKFFSAFMPRFWVMICKRGAYELMAEEVERKKDTSWKPELSGEARWNAIKPIAEWKPKVME